MENKKNLPLQVITLVLLVAAIVVYAWILIGGVEGATLSVTPIYVILTIFAMIAGINYVLRGYKKNAAASYKSVLWLTAVAALFGNALCMLSSVDSIITAILVPLGFGLLVVISVGKDLGKITTDAMAIALVAIRLLLMLGVIASGQFTSSKLIMLDGIGQLIIAVIILLLVKGKYSDKAERETK